jgi:soluble lytic murein transglycosylase-like protein
MTIRHLLIGAALLAAPGLAQAASDPAPAGAASVASLDADAAARYKAILAKLDGGKWADARDAILKLDESDTLRPFLLARLYLAKGSPKVDLFDLLDLLAKAPHLPQAEQIGKLAAKRGAQILPEKPQVRQLVYRGGAPQRRTLSAVKDDPAADAIRDRMLERIVANDPIGAEELLELTEGNFTADGRTELRHRIGWSYYLNGDTYNARRMALHATDSGSGAWLASAWWTAGLAAWREGDWNDASQAFYKAAREATDGDMRSAGYYWAARATMANRHPERVNDLLRAAAREGESFYGLLARETLGYAPEKILPREAVSARDWADLTASPNARNAALLIGLGQAGEADASLRREAELTGGTRYAALVHLASVLNMPATQLWLAQRVPGGGQAGAYDRFPSPDWEPALGWQVDKALVYAHALQESRFQTDARSSADARGVMQVVPATGRELAAKAGMSFAAEQLYDPAVNLALGQLYLKKLAAMPATGGLLPKVVAAYNAGPTPVDRWNTQVRDNGDPLLFIESVPYYETRAYLNAVLRNYFVYQMEQQGVSPALKAMAQGMWTRFPDGKKTIAVRMTGEGRTSGAD